MKDWRRMNVAFTRARSKLIIFGSRQTLQAAPLLAEFFTLMDSQGWILPLPKDADQLHVATSAVVQGAVTPTKRGAEDQEEVKKSPKKVKMSAFAEDGLLRGRPILKDLLNADK